MTVFRKSIRAIALILSVVFLVLGIATCSDEDTPVCPTSGNSNLVTYIFAFEIRILQDDANLLEGAIEVGDLLVGTVTWNMTVSDTLGYPQVHIYNFVTAPCGFTVTHNDLVFKTDPKNVRMDMMIADNYAEFFTPEDYIRFISYNQLPVIDDDETIEIRLTLGGDTTPLDSVDLPSTLPDLSVWNEASVSVQQSSTRGNFYFSGNILAMSKQ